MKILSKLVCCLLAVLMVLTVLCACTPNTPDDPNKPDSPDNPDNPNQPDEEEVDYLLTLPERDYNEEVIRILCRTDKLYEIYADEDAVSTIEAAVFARNSRVEEYCGVTLDHYDLDGSWSSASQSAFKSAVINNNK